MPFFSNSADFPQMIGDTGDSEAISAHFQMIGSSVDSAHQDISNLAAALAPYQPTTMRDVDGKVLGVLASQLGSAPPIYGLEGYLIYPATGTPWLIPISEVMAEHAIFIKGVKPRDQDHFYIQFDVTTVDSPIPYLSGIYTFEKEGARIENSGALWDAAGSEQTYFRLPVYFRGIGIDDNQAPKLVSNGGVFREDIFTSGGLPVVGIIRIS
jgi:hypothetical protein